MLLESAIAVRRNSVTALKSTSMVIVSPPLAAVVLLSIASVTCSHNAQPPGPRPVEFAYWNPSAKEVFLAGSFNGWNTTSAPMHRGQHGDWSAVVALKPGHHQYKFIADGHWTQDPANADSAADLSGGENSVLTVNPGVHQDGLAERKRISAAVHRLFEAQNFTALEKQASELRTKKTRLPQGRWELSTFYEGLNETDYDGGNQTKWADAFAKFDAWHQQYPKSITEPVARAHSLIGYAWQARGSGWSTEVSSEGGHLMDERLKQARAVLDTAAKLPERCPEWYAAMQIVALGQEWSRHDYDQLFNEAVAREPTYYEYYFNKSYFLVPRWYGRRGEWERFAKDAASRYDKKEGLTLYARIAWSKDFLYGNLFRESSIHWRKMRQGFFDIMKRWPNSDWNRNNFCRFACMARDHNTAAKLFKEIGGKFDYDVWHSGKQFEAARRWANTDKNSPAVVAQYHLDSPPTTRPSALALASQEQRYYAGYENGILNRWDPQAGRDLVFITRFQTAIKDIAASPVGNTIAIAVDGKNDASGSVKILDTVTGAEKASIDDWSGSPYALAFSADGSTLAAVGGTTAKPGVAKIWDVKTKTPTPVPWPPPKHLLVAVALSPDGRLLMTNDDRNVRVWDVRQNKFVFQTSEQMPELVQGVAFSPDGKLAAAVCSRDSWQSDDPGLLVIWNAADWTELKRIPLDCGGRHVAFSPDNYLGITRRDNTISVWNTSDWKSATECLPMGGYISAMTYSPDGKGLAAATHDDGISVWQLPSTQ
jgi:WD40 repeat protein